MSRAKASSPTKGWDTSKTVAMKDRIKIGQSIANQLEPVNSARDVAKHFGISEQALRKAECLALFKVSAKLKELFAHLNNHE
jgi:hypothetical protein